jgi:hypothetical protein
MITRICEGTSQIQRVVIAQPAAVPGQIGLTYATRDQMGVDVGGDRPRIPTLLYKL